MHSEILQDYIANLIARDEENNFEVLCETTIQHEDQEDDLSSSGTIFSVNTYEEAGMLTSDKGLVISADGYEFQVTILRSR